MPEQRISRACGFTIGFEGLTRFEPISVQRIYNVDAKSIDIRCCGDLAELAFKRPDRVRIDCKDCAYKIGEITRDLYDNSVNISVVKKSV